MRTLRIRSFTLLCLFFIVFMPWLFLVAAHFMETKTFSFEESKLQNEIQQRQLSEMIRLIEINADKWRDPQWQNRLHDQLRQAKMDVAILSASNQEIYRSDPERSGGSTERFSVIEDGHVVGKIIIYMPRSNAFQMMAALGGLLLAFFVAGFEMRRFLLKPLEKMSVAVKQMAAGDWDVKLPVSRITEIAKVRDGFEMLVDALQKSHQKQVELEEERRFVIAAVAHDLRTPLFALRGYLDGLEQGIAQSPEKIAKYVAVCKEKSAQLDRLVEDLFTFTKVTYLEENHNKQSADLKLVLLKAIDSLSPLASQKHITISIHTADDCIISGDPHLLERAMNNLLDNAVRHAPCYGKITVQSFKDGNNAIFSIHDTGPGFSPEELQRVFEPLYRGEQSRNRATGGSGLGLTISQRIVRQHGGELTAHNHSEGGALLTGWIPLMA